MAPFLTFHKCGCCSPVLGCFKYTSCVFEGCCKDVSFMGALVFHIVFYWWISEVLTVSRVLWCSVGVIQHYLQILSLAQLTATLFLDHLHLQYSTVWFPNIPLLSLSIINNLVNIHLCLILIDFFPHAPFDWFSFYCTIQSGPCLMFCS